MFKKLFGRSEKPESNTSLNRGGPYQVEGLNLLYSLLFCDDLELYRASHRGQVDDVWQLLFGDPQDLTKLRAVADDEGVEARIRALAYLRLRQTNEDVPKKRLLGTVLEVGLPGGLDTLAAYADGTARYFNQSGKFIVWETPGSDPRIDELIKDLLSASQQVVNRIGPWDKARLGPPSANIFRMSFVVSDGLHFGQGPMQTLQRDPMGGPVIAIGTQLLQALISKASG